MSLHRVSYLESWQNNPPAFLRRRGSNASSDDEENDIQYLPESTASSFPSTIGPYSIRNRLNFNPYSGPSWAESTHGDADDERESLIGHDPVEDRETPDVPVSPGTLETTGPPKDTSHWDTLETTGAFEVPKGKRIAQVCVAVVYCLLAAGIVFGFAAIKPVLIREGVYRDYCTKEELQRGGQVCYGQEIRLNLMFTVAAVATNVCALPVGTILDVYGPRVCGIIGSISLALGASLFAFSRSLPFDGYMPGYLFLALGGPFVFISSFQLSNTFPTRSGLILSMLTGAFDASSALFLVFRILNETTAGGFSVKTFFTIYLIVPLFILIVEILLMPSTSYKTAGELVQQAQGEIVDEVNDELDDGIVDQSERERQRKDRRHHRESVVSSIRDLLGDGTGDRKISDLNFDPSDPEFCSRQREPAKKQSPLPAEKTHSTGGVWGAMHGASALQQIKSPWFILITLFTILQMLRINYFVATVRQQYTYLLDSPGQAEQLNRVFDLLLPLGGLLSIPFIGTILDTATTPVVLLILVTVATLIGILGCIPGSPAAGYANIALFVLYRPFYYTAVSDYSAKVFGFQTFGKVYGLVICLAGISNFAQAGLDALTFKAFHRNPIPVNAILTLMAFLVGTGLVGFVWWKARVMAASGVHSDVAALQETRDDTAGERRPLLS
ncbi:hypothetical protein Plec18167_004512 [Paecilomyces lecythidis]|uniref:MFS transporter Fmp42 n=1 Tax=Paecilomyces lecythidis TaxID=3004212 RepID=A0ABR3XR25_9EURO